MGGLNTDVGGCATNIDASSGMVSQVWVDSATVSAMDGNATECAHAQWQDASPKAQPSAVDMPLLVYSSHGDDVSARHADDASMLINIAISITIHVPRRRRMRVSNGEGEVIRTW